MHQFQKSLSELFCKRSPPSDNRIHMIHKRMPIIILQILMGGCFGFNGPLRQYFSLYQAEYCRQIMYHAT